jgi:PAS domain S-box-containing protein
MREFLATFLCRALGLRNPKELERELAESKRSEQILLANEERLRLLADSVKDHAICTLNAEGRVASWNEGAQRLQGYGGPEILGQPASCFYVPEEQRQGKPAQDLQAAASAGRLEVEAWRTRRDGSCFWANVVLTARTDEHGKLSGFTQITRDITGRRQLEEQLYQAQKMEAVGRLAGGIAHDFNNLLTIITGYSELLLNRFPPADPAHATLKEIRSAGDRATALTRQLLAFSRKQVLAPQILDLSVVVSDIKTMLRRLIGEDIALRILPGSNLGRVKADAGQIDQVLLNLAVNARDAMPKGGVLVIETRNAELDAASLRVHADVLPGPYVLLAVSDTGCGMDEATRAHLFEPFFTTKEKGKGTGLGLATVYGIVKQSGGHIEVDTVPGKGSTFKVYLPRVAPAPLPPAAATPVSSPGKGSETILLVEDETAVRQLVNTLLSKQGYKVLEARDGVRALQVASGHPGSIDLLLTDMVMPLMNGHELAQRLTAGHSEMKVLYMSGYTESVFVRGGVARGEMALLHKPFSPDKLAHKVRSVLDKPARPMEFVPAALSEPATPDAGS